MMYIIIMFVLIISHILVVLSRDIFLEDIIYGNPPFPFKIFDYEAFSGWKHLDLIDKLYYLLEYHDVAQFYDEYLYILSVTEASPPVKASNNKLPVDKKELESNTIQLRVLSDDGDDDNNTGKITYEILSKFLEEYQSHEKIQSYWKECDADQNDVLDLTEYIICRGPYDGYGNISDVSEYDLRANGLIANFENLMSSGEPIPGLYVYDENGIIIDQ